MTPEEVSQRELQHACYHEYAHQTVAMHYGVRSIVAIWKPEDCDPVLERAWWGNCSLMAAFKRPRHQRMTALAGEVAVMVLRGDDLGPDDAWDNLQYDMSESDKRMAGAFSVSDVEYCFTIVNRLWPQIAKAAELGIACHSYHVGSSNAA